MATSVTIVYPNARRLQLKIQPTTRILDIIEEACMKQGLVPNDYGVVHQKRSIDVTLAFRLTGIPNNAILELKKCENGPRKFEDVTIVLQLDDGTRLTAKTFK
jgi:tether containing UBX domain for GLUT4